MQKQVAIVKFDRHLKETEVILCQEDNARHILEQMYLRELVNNKFINFDNTYIHENDALIDYVDGYREIRITHNIIQK